MTGISEFVLARATEDAENVEKRIQGEIESLRRDGVTVTRDELLTSKWRDGVLVYDSSWLARPLAEAEAKLRVVEWHRNWPVLIETPPTLEGLDDPSSMTLRMTRKIRWATEREYVAKFGAEPPTGPVLRMLAAVYVGHSDYLQEWAL